MIFQITKKNINPDWIQSHHLKIIDFSKNVITEFNLSQKAKEGFCLATVMLVTVLGCWRLHQYFFRHVGDF